MYHGSMVEITGHVADLTSSSSKSQTKKLTKYTTLGYLITCPKQPKHNLTKIYSLSFRFYNLASFLFFIRFFYYGVLCPLPKVEQMVASLTPRDPVVQKSLQCGSLVSAKSGAHGANSGGAVETTWKVKKVFGGDTFATWQPSKVSFLTVEETGVALGTITSMAEIGGTVNTVMSSTWSSSSIDWFARSAATF